MPFDLPIFNAIILAGGAGSRLSGVNKAQIDLAGAPLIDRSLRACAAAQHLVVVGPTEAIALGSLPASLAARTMLTREDPPGGGPAAATVAGVRRLAIAGADAEWTLVLSCDLPLAEAGVRRLLDEVSRRGCEDSSTHEISTQARPWGSPGSISEGGGDRHSIGEGVSGPGSISGGGDDRGSISGETVEPGSGTEGGGDRDSISGGVSGPGSISGGGGERDSIGGGLGGRVDGFYLRGSTGRLEPLFALYRTSALRAAAARLPHPEGAAMRHLVEDLVLEAVDDPGGHSRDLDTWEDHREWTRRLEGGDHD